MAVHRGLPADHQALAGDAAADRPRDLRRRVNLMEDDAVVTALLGVCAEASQPSRGVLLVHDGVPDVVWGRPERPPS